MIEQRQCGTCKEWKELLIAFPKDSKSKGGYRATCKECSNKQKFIDRRRRDPLIGERKRSAAEEMLERRQRELCHVFRDNVWPAEPANDLYWRVA